MSTTLHRLFLALPVPPVEAERLALWAAHALAGKPVRLVPAHQLHATLLFFGDVDSPKRDEMAKLVAGVAAVPFPVRVGPLRLYGRSALAVALLAAPNDLAGLEERVFCQPPLNGLLAYLHPAERRRPGIRLHITVARAREPIALPSPPPPLEAVLGRIALFESRLSSSGPTYTELAG